MVYLNCNLKYAKQIHGVKAFFDKIFNIKDNNDYDTNNIQDTNFR